MHFNTHIKYSLFATLILQIAACSSSVEEVNKLTLEPPIASADPVGGIYNSVSSVTLSCQPSSNRICTIYFTKTVNNQNVTNEQLYTQPIKLEANKTTILSFYGDDGELRENPKNQIYTIDKINPTLNTYPIADSVIGPTDSIVLSFSESINTLSFDLKGSIVDQSDGGIFSTTDGNNDTFTLKPNNMWVSGRQNLIINALDLAGNPLTPRTLDYTVINIAADMESPTTTVTPSKPEHNAAFDISFSCADTGESGCAKIWYSIDGITDPRAGKFFDLSLISNPTLNISTSLTLKFQSEDNNGNLESIQSIDYIIDNEAPYTTTDTLPDTAPFKDPINIILTCNDLPINNNAACDKIVYTLNGVEQSFSTLISSSVSIPLSTTTTLRYYSVDKAGNTEQPLATQKYVFGATPKTTITPAKREYNTPVTVSFTCINGIGGKCAKIWYSVDGSELTTQSRFFDLLVNANPILTISKTSTLKYKAEDKNGIVETPKSANYIIENKAPFTNVSIPGSDGPFNARFFVELTCYDTLVSPQDGNAGCDKLDYTFGNVVGTILFPNPNNAKTTFIVENTTSLSYYSVDKAGNKEAARTESYVFDLIAPTYTTELGIYPLGSIIFVFNEAMNTSPGALTISGNIATQIGKTIWSNSAGGTNNTLTFQPKSTWAVGPGSTLTLAASDIAGNSVTTSQLSYSLLPSIPLNDTGLTTCSNFDSNGLTCNTAGDGTGIGPGGGTTLYPSQDAMTGRDALNAAGQLLKIGGGRAGFDFTKMDASGIDLGINTTIWSCVRDNVTGLIWEVKTFDKGLHDKNWTYSWYNSTSINDGGGAGTPNSGSCNDSSNCDTEKFVAAVNNSVGLCGFNTGWRLPSIEELYSLENGNVALEQPGTSIDTNWFPNSLVGNIWSSSPAAVSSPNAWANTNGNIGLYNKSSGLSVRLVHDGQ